MAGIRTTWRNRRRIAASTSAMDRSAVFMVPMRAAVRGILGGPVPVVATVARRGGGLIAEVKRRPDAELRTVTRATRDALPGAIAEWLRAHAPPRRSGDGAVSRS